MADTRLSRNLMGARALHMAFAAALCLAGAAHALGYKVNVDAEKGWHEGLEEVAVVVTQCHESMNAEDLRKQISTRLLEQAKKLPFSIVQDRKVAEIAGWDWDGKDAEALRKAVFEKTTATAIFEVQAPFASGGEFTVRGAEVRVRVRVMTRDGAAKMSGDCSAQAFNTASSPENIARHCALRLLGDALGKNLD